MSEKRTIILEELFFKSNLESIHDVLKEMRKYDEIIFQQMNYDVRIDSRSLEEYAAGYDTFVDAGIILVTNSNYNQLMLYHELVDYIKKEVEY